MSQRETKWAPLGVSAPQLMIVNLPYVLTTQIQIFWNSKTARGCLGANSHIFEILLERPCLSARLPFIGHSNRQIPRARREILTNKSFVNYHP